MQNNSREDRQAHPYFMNSERIGFSHWTENDLSLAQALWGDPEVSRYITASGVFTADEIKARLQLEIQNGKEYAVQYWPMFLLENSEFVGVCGLRPHGRDKEYEIGCHLMKKFWNKGLAAEAAGRVIAYAFDDLAAESLFAGHNPLNTRSAHVLTKLGFTSIGKEYYPPTGLMHPSYRLGREKYSVIQCVPKEQKEVLR